MRMTCTQRTWLAVCSIGLLLVLVTASSAQKLSCESILKDAYDRSRGLVVWDDFPKIGIPIGDSERQFFVDGGVPLAEAMWRFMNGISYDQTFHLTPYFAARVNSIKDVDELWGNKSLYVPFSKISGSSPVPAEQINLAARDVLKSRIDAGATIITSYNFDIQEQEGGKALRVAFVSPVIKNIPPSGLSFSDLAIAFLEVFTNLRIEDFSALRDEVTEEYSVGCLQKFSKQCVVFGIAKNMYRHASELRKETKVDVANEICSYVNAE